MLCRQLLFLRDHGNALDFLEFGDDLRIIAGAACVGADEESLNDGVGVTGCHACGQFVSTVKNKRW